MSNRDILERILYKIGEKFNINLTFVKIFIGQTRMISDNVIDETLLEIKTLLEEVD